LSVVGLIEVWERISYPGGNKFRGFYIKSANRRLISGR
jgi:hypothetical protein